MAEEPDPVDETENPSAAAEKTGITFQPLLPRADRLTCEVETLIVVCLLKKKRKERVLRNRLFNGLVIREFMYIKSFRSLRFTSGDLFFFCCFFCSG